MTSSMPLWTFPTVLPPLSERRGQRRSPAETWPLLGARLYLLTIKMSAPLGSFLSQYLLF